MEGAWDDVVAGSECVVARRGEELHVAGWNEHGNLGTGDTHDRRAAARLTLSADRARPLLAAGGGHCAAAGYLRP